VCTEIDFQRRWQTEDFNYGGHGVARREEGSFVFQSGSKNAVETLGEYTDGNFVVDSSSKIDFRGKCGSVKLPSNVAIQ